MTTQKIISCQISDMQELQTAYMSRIKDGGLFVKTADRYQLGDELILVLGLPGEGERYIVKVQVVWLAAPKGKEQGIGVRFIDAVLAAKLKQLIETKLAALTPAELKSKTF